MARFKHTDNSQTRFVAVNLNDQIQLGTFEWAVNHIYRQDRHGIIREKVRQ